MIRALDAQTDRAEELGGGDISHGLKRRRPMLSEVDCAVVQIEGTRRNDGTLERKAWAVDRDGISLREERLVRHRVARVDTGLEPGNVNDRLAIRPRVPRFQRRGAIAATSVSG